MTKRFALVLLLLSPHGLLRAQTTTWTGATSTAWTTATNWSSGVPTSTVNVTIPVRTRQPTLTSSGSCRSLVVASGATLTLASRATLDLFTTATATGVVAGTGAIVTSGTAATLSGRFSNVIANSACRLTTGTTLSGALTANADVLIYSACTLDSLAIAAGAVATIERNATVSVQVMGSFVVAAGGTLDNQATVPVVLRGTALTIRGPVRGDLALEVGTTTLFSLLSTVSGDVNVGTVAGQRLSIDGNGVGRITGKLTVTATSAGRGNLYLSDLVTGDVDLTATNVWVIGTVTSVDFKMFVTQLRGGPTDQLSVDTLSVPGASQLTDSPPGRILVRRGININSSNTFAPLRGTIVFNDPATPVTVGVSDNPLPSFAEVRVENNTQVQFRSGPSNGTGKGPRIENLIVTAGTADAVYCTLNQVLVEPAGTLIVRTEQAAHQSIVGPTTVRGAATFTDTDFGSSTLANSLTVESGGTALVGNGSLTVTGAVRIASGEVRLGSQVGLVLTTTGRLTLDGTPSAPAVIVGNNSAMQLDGAIDARSFRISGMNSLGVRVGSGAVLGARPFDFRGGHFTGGRPGGVLLDLTRSVPTSLFDLDFDNVGGATRNLRATAASAAITVVDSRGNLAGEAFDDDAANRVTWRANATTVVEVAARPGVLRNVVTFRSTAEETTAFRLNRAPAPPLAPIAATGPNTYTIVDDGLVARTRYTYTLERERLSPFAGPWQALATAAATPHARDEGITRFVGPNGYPDVATALVGAPSGAIVFVSPGTYGGFAITRPTRVIGEGLVTITAAVTVSNLPAPTGDVVLDGLTFLPGAALTVTDVAPPVILRALSLSGLAATEGLRLQRSPRVALQRFTVTNATVIATATVHASSCVFGAVAVTQSSRFVHATTSATSITPDGTSTVTAHQGACALLDLVPAWSAGVAQTVRVRGGGGGHLFSLLLGTAHDYIDLSAVLPLDMVLLLAPTTMIALPGGILDAAGGATFTLPGPPNSGTVGLSIQLQVQTLDPVAVRARFAEIRQVVLLR